VRNAVHNPNANHIIMQPNSETILTFYIPMQYTISNLPVIQNTVHVAYFKHVYVKYFTTLPVEIGLLHDFSLYTIIIDIDTDIAIADSTFRTRLFTLSVTSMTH